MTNIFGRVLCLVAMVTIVYSCSVPEGGYTVPTPSEIVGYSDLVVVGEVTEIILPDPMFGDMYGDSSYGAMVTVHCTYKGSVLPGRIKIGGAGVVPGMCTAKHLEKGKQYVLFLYDKDTQRDSFEQSEIAALNTSLKDYLGVCGLRRDYPAGKGMMSNKDVCPEVEPSASCNTPGDTKQPNPTASDPNQTPNENQPEVQDAKTGKSTSDDGNTASMVTATSVSAILFSFLCYMML